MVLASSIPADQVGERSRAILMPRGLFGLYGVGYVAVSAAGVTYRWSGWLLRARGSNFPWTDVRKIVVNGRWVHITVAHQFLTASAFVFQPTATREALVRWAPAGVIRVRGGRQSTQGRPR
jgi:hypothetical protein